MDEWVNAFQCWLLIEGIDIDSVKALKVVEFKAKGSPLTTDQYFRRHKCKDAIFFGFMLVWHNFLISSTSLDLSWQKWMTAYPTNKSRNMGIKKFCNSFAVIQVKHTDKYWKQIILEEVKRWKFLNDIPYYIIATLISQIKKNRTCEYLVQLAQSYEGSKLDIT